MTSIESSPIPFSAPNSAQSSASAQQGGAPGASAQTPGASTDASNNTTGTNNANGTDSANNTGNANNTGGANNANGSPPATSSSTTSTSQTQTSQTQADQTQAQTQAGQTTQAMPAPAAHVAVNFAMAAEEIHADFKSALMRSLPPEILEQILNDAGGADIDLINLLTKLDKMLLNRSIAIDPSNIGQADRMEQWLRLIIGNPKLAYDFMERIPLSGARDIAQLIEKLMSLIGEKGNALRDIMAQFDMQKNNTLSNMMNTVSANTTGNANNIRNANQPIDTNIARTVANTGGAINTNSAANTPTASSTGYATNTNNIVNTNNAVNTSNTNSAGGTSQQNNTAFARQVVNTNNAANTVNTNNINSANNTNVNNAPRQNTNNIAQQNININTNAPQQNANVILKADTVANMSRSAFNSAPAALIDIARDSGSSFAALDKKLDSADAQKIVNDIQKMLPQPEKENVIKMVHDAKTLLPQSARADIAPAPLAQDQTLAASVKNIRSEYIDLLDRSVNALLGNNNNTGGSITAIREKIDSLDKLVANIAKLPIAQTDTSRTATANNAPQNIGVSNNTIANSTSTAAQLINTLSNAVSAMQNRIDQTGNLNIAERLNLFNQVRDTVSKLDETVRPLASEERFMPKSFYDRVAASNDYKISDQIKNNVFARIDNAQNLLTRIPAEIKTPPMPRTADMKLPQTSFTATASSSSSKNTSSTITPASSDAAQAKMQAAQKSNAPMSPPNTILDSVKQLWSASEHIRMGFREAFFSLDLESRVSPLSSSEGSVAHVIKQNADALRMSILLEVSGALREIGASTEMLRESIAQFLSATDLSKALLEELAKAIRVLEQEARNGSLEIMEKLKDILKELSRLQTDLARSQESASSRGSTPADVIRSTALTLARGLESLSLLAAQTKGMETQHQLLSLPVKMGEEWTEVHIKFVREQKDNEGKDNGHVSIYVNTEPSALGALTAHFDYNPPALLKLSIQFEKDEATKWFKEHAGVLREAIAGAGFQGVSFDFRTKPGAVLPVAKEVATLDNAIIKDDKVDVKI